MLMIFGSLAKRASKVEGASPIQELPGAPGGGQMVTITDPDGFLFNVIYGQEERLECTSTRPAEKLKINYPKEKQRLRQFNRFEPGPAAVHKVSSLFVLHLRAPLYLSSILTIVGATVSWAILATPRNALRSSSHSTPLISISFPLICFTWNMTVTERM